MPLFRSKEVIARKRSLLERGVEIGAGWGLTAAGAATMLFVPPLGIPMMAGGMLLGMDGLLRGHKK